MEKDPQQQPMSSLTSKPTGATTEESAASRQPHGTLDINAVGTLSIPADNNSEDGGSNRFKEIPITAADLSDSRIFVDKPWRRPGADLTDYFNFGFDEDSWRAYCAKQRDFRRQFGGRPLPYARSTPAFRETNEAPYNRSHGSSRERLQPQEAGRQYYPRGDAVRQPQPPREERQAREARDDRYPRDDRHHHQQGHRDERYYRDDRRDARQSSTASEERSRDDRYARDEKHSSGSGRYSSRGEDHSRHPPPPPPARY